MAFCELKYFSPALGKMIAANLILPEGDIAPPYATFYLLHGLSDDHTAWERRTSIERYVADLPMIVVMPDGGRGFYADAQEGPAWETSIAVDLLNYVDKMFPTYAAREGRCVGGLSMGGYGAMRLALNHPDLFCSAVSHSGALSSGHNADRVEHGTPFYIEMRRIFGENPTGTDYDLYALAKKQKPAEKPALRIDCGTEDFLIQENRDFHAYLKSIGYTHEYAEFPGEHTWSYWDTHVQEAIQFHLKNLKLPKAEAVAK